MPRLLSPEELPGGFTYPPSFLRAVEHGLVDLQPWFIIEGDSLLRRVRGLKKRHPDRTVVPFAARRDNDDVGCFELGSPAVVVLYDFESEGWEQGPRFDDFNAWLRQALEDFIEFEAGEF